jgi:hypothetical protein
MKLGPGLKAPGLTHKHLASMKCLPGTNTLAYHEHS